MKPTDSVSSNMGVFGAGIDRLSGNPFVQNIRARQAYSQSVLPSIDRVDISPLGRLVNELHLALSQISDRSQRELALIGLQSSIRVMIEGSANAQMLKFLSLLFHLKSSDEGLYQELFRTAGQLLVGGYDSEEWMQICAEIGREPSLRTFVEETSAIIGIADNADSPQLETFRFFLSTWKVRYPFGKTVRSADKRKYLRRRMRLSGYYQSLPTLVGSEIVIRDLSPGGFSFEVLGDHPPRENEVIQVFFILDDYIKRKIKKLAVVRRWDGNFGGAQFCH